MDYKRFTVQEFKVHMKPKLERFVIFDKENGRTITVDEFLRVLVKFIRS